MVTIKLSHPDNCGKFDDLYKKQKYIANFIDCKCSYIPKELSRIKILMDPERGNPLLDTIITGYLHNINICISPDDIWLTICQSLIIHLEYNTHIFKTMNIKYNTNHYREFVNSRFDYINEHFKLLKDTFTFNFTTSPTKKEGCYTSISSEFIKFTDFDSYKDFNGGNCGIPNIILKGTSNDWQAIIDKLRGLLSIPGIGVSIVWWVRNLIPLIREFVNVFNDKVNTEFWKNIVSSSCTGCLCYGWILNFFPYCKYGARRTTLINRVYDEIHNGQGNIPINKNKTMVSGFIGINLDETNKCISPVIGWYVTNTNNKLCCNIQ